MDTARIESWKSMLRSQAVLKGKELASDGKTIEFKFCGEELSYTLDPSGSRVSGIDEGDQVVFYFHGRNPIYHMWEDLFSVTIRH